ncbi:MAG: L-threonylcarbamoyladenylate synthase [Candidatus Thorarchaeota archaeon]
MTLTPTVHRVTGPESHTQAIEKASRILLEGGLVVCPTDTSYGLACDPKQKSSLERLLTTKERGRKLGVPLLFSDMAQSQTYHDFRNLEKVIARLFWPGALTLLVAAGERIPRYITGGKESVAIRVPNHPIPRGIAAEIGGPIVGTSANRSGGPSPFEISVAVEQLGDDVDLYIDAGPSEAQHDSTIVSVEGPGGEGEPLCIKVHREGQLSVEKMTKSLRTDSDAMRFWTTRIDYVDL